MHYYKRNLGDYAKKAGRLSMLQHGSYTLLIDACYDREKFPTLEDAIEWTWASTTEEIEAVTFVLRKFFTLEDGVYVQKRLQEEIAKYHSKAETNKRIAEERELNKRESLTGSGKNSTKRAPVVHERSPNQEPRTTNQEPVTNNNKDKDLAQPPACADKPGAQTADGNGFPAFWQAYPKKRSKGDAEKAWKSLKPDKALQTMIIAAVEQAKKREDWVKDGGQFIPYPATWLRDRGWEDIDLVAVAAQQPPKRRPCCWVDAHGAPCTAEAVGNVSGKGYCQNSDHKDFAFYGKKGKP